MCSIYVDIHYILLLFNLCEEIIIQMAQYVWLYHICCNCNAVQRNRNYCSGKKYFFHLLVCKYNNDNTFFREFVAYMTL